MLNRKFLEITLTGKMPTMNKTLKYAGGITTVAGTINPEELGFCQCHEHLFIAPGQVEKINPALKIDDYDLTLQELLLYKAQGGVSVVDAQPLACGRMPQNLLRAAEASGVNIIAATGFHKLVFYPENHWIQSVDGATFAQLLIDELTSGMYLDGDEALPARSMKARAGIIKTAVETVPIDKQYRKLLEAAAYAAKTTGAPLMCHTEMGEGALEVVQIFTACGVPCDSIIICHLDRRVDNLPYHLEVAKSGVFLDYDSIGRLKYHTDEAEADLIGKMIQHGQADRILLALDTTRERLRSYGGTIGLDYILQTFIPLLEAYGLDRETIAKLTVLNPSRALRTKRS